MTLNPAVDLFISVDALHPGELHRVSTPMQYPGGKGLNVSKMLAQLDVPTRTTGFLGGARGRYIMEQLQDLGVTADFIPIADESRINVKVIDGQGVLTELNSPAPAIRPQEWERLERQLRDLTGTDLWLALCGNLPEGCRDDWYYDAIINAADHGVHTLLDASGAALERGVAAGPDVIKPNTHELEALTGSTFDTVAQVARAASQLVAQGVGTVVVSMGADGLVAVTRSTAVHVEVPRGPVVSSVGAGDTVVAALLYGLCHHLPFTETIRFAAAAGTAKVRQPGTQPPTRQIIEACLADTQIHNVEGSQ